MMEQVYDLLGKVKLEDESNGLCPVCVVFQGPKNDQPQHSLFCCRWGLFNSSSGYKQFRLKLHINRKGICYVCYVPQKDPFDHQWGYDEEKDKPACADPHKDIIFPILFALLNRREALEMLVPLVQEGALEKVSTMEKFATWLLALSTDRRWENYLHLLYHFGVHYNLISPVSD